jgi:hypothetical protein
MIRKLLVDKVRNKAWSETLMTENPYARIRDMSIASRHIKQIVVFQIQEDLDNA